MIPSNIVSISTEYLIELDLILDSKEGDKALSTISRLKGVDSYSYCPCNMQLSIFCSSIGNGSTYQSQNGHLDIMNKVLNIVLAFKRPLTDHEKRELELIEANTPPKDQS